ncbi:hypothetical protein Bca4012_042290 [Brassica carinata]
MRRWDVGKDQAQKQAVKDTRTATVPEAIENRRTKTCAAINRLKCRQDNQEHIKTSQGSKKRRSEVRRHCKWPLRKHRQPPFKPLTRASRVGTELEHHQSITPAYSNTRLATVVKRPTGTP